MGPSRAPTRLRSAAALIVAASCACRTVAPATRAPPEVAVAPQPALAFVALATTSSPPPVYTLTTSDGTGLRLASLEIQAVVQGPLALTQLRLEFDNPEDRTIEGHFSVTLPEGAAVSRFAMKIGDRWQEGEVVERMAAKMVYENFLHRRIDPALLEQDAGNSFKARVFPIAGRQRKELILSYSQELAGTDASYRVPLLGLPRIDALRVRVVVPGQPTQTLERAAYVPEGDLVLRLDPSRTSAGVRNGALVGARVELIADDAATPPAKATGWTILLDTSASQAVGFGERVRGLVPLLAALHTREGRDIAVEVVGFDQEQVSFYRGPASGFGEAQVAAILERDALGASDLTAALRTAQRAAQAGSRVLIVGDGVSTIGQVEASASSSAATDAHLAGVTRIDALLAGAGDRASLQVATTPHRGAAAGVVVDAARAPDEILDRLFAPVLHDVAVEVPGSRWVLPERLDGVQPGDSVMVYAEVDGFAPLHVQFRAPLREQRVATTFVERPLLARSMHGAELRELTAQHARADSGARTDLRDRIVRLSLAHRVLSPFTAMLVLETAYDYQRFGLDRRALSDILVVGDDGVEVMARGRPHLTNDPSAAQDALETGRQIQDRADSDGDGVPDARDRCPAQPEDVDGDRDEDGCPEVLAYDNCRIRLRDRIYFKAGRWDIHPRSRARIDDVRMTLEAAPDITLWIDGHADAGSDGESGQKLSQRRADAVRQALIARRIDPDRLDARGAGATLPRHDGTTADGRAENRRVEFSIKDCFHAIAPAFTGTARPALAGPFLAVDEALARDPAEALRLARTWWSTQPADPLAALALGRSLAAAGQTSAAARAYATLIDQAPSRAEHRRHAGQRLEALGSLEHAIDTYRHAVRLRPDHPSSHRLLAFALARQGRHAEAFAAAEVGRSQQYADHRFAHHILEQDLTILGAAWIRSDPAARPEVERRLAAHDLVVAHRPSLRFVTTWEADAADVDLHLTDAGGRPSTSRSNYLNNTRGHGPDALILVHAARDYPYALRVHYTRRGPAGHAMGGVHVLEHDGNGRLGSVTLPFVLMLEGGDLEVGVIAGPLIAPTDPRALVPAAPAAP